MNTLDSVPKYPRTPYWPASPSIPPGDRVTNDTSRFVGTDVIITEKIDGANTLLHLGQIYNRSTTARSTGKWTGLVRKHHAWKLIEPHLYLYGEDIYAVHSIVYAPVAESATFYAFALRINNTFTSFRYLERFAQGLDIPSAPLLFEGQFRSEAALNDFIRQAHAAPSQLGGEREGIVLRRAGEFAAEEFERNVCKSVRAQHVQTDEHWTRNWRPCNLAGAAAPTPYARHSITARHRSVPLQDERSVQEFLEITEDTHPPDEDKHPTTYHLGDHGDWRREVSRQEFTKTIRTLAKHLPTHEAWAKFDSAGIHCHIEATGL